MQSSRANMRMWKRAPIARQLLQYVYRSIPLLRRLFRIICIRRIAWALRRLDLPVGPNDLVLELGSGDNPYPRANVSVDLYVDNRERAGDLNFSRPLVLADAHYLPFADKVFDFVIASHVLEHSDDPVKFLSELQRVARAGYIETPHAFMEQIMPYSYHRLRIRADGDTLILTKKPCYAPNPELLKDFNSQLNTSAAFKKYLYDYTDLFYVCFHWRDKINFVLTNPDVDSNWPAPNATDLYRGSISSTFKIFLRRMTVGILRM